MHVAIIGAGVAGLCAARSLPDDVQVTILERGQPGQDQSTHNSGVLHPGVEYVPGSQKAHYATRGASAARAYAREHGIPAPRRGMLVAATDDDGVAGVHEYQRRGAANGVTCHLVGPGEARAIEPAIGDIVAGLHVPGVHSIDSRAYVDALVNECRQRGVRIHCNWPVTTIQEQRTGAVLSGPQGEVRCDAYLNAAGTHVDELACQVDADEGCRIVPFRGDYLEVDANVNGHVYPAPDLAMPFLGIHVSRLADGRVVAGPNAVPAGCKDAYGRFAIHPREMAKTLAYRGTWRLAVRPTMLSHATREAWHTVNRRAFLKDARRLVPGLKHRGPAFSGIRAQLVTPDGDLVMDLKATRSDHGVHVLSGASPGLTASLPFGADVARMLTS